MHLGHVAISIKLNRDAQKLRRSLLYHASRTKERHGEGSDRGRPDPSPNLLKLERLSSR
jgi:hypothetical protein